RAAKGVRNNDGFIGLRNHSGSSKSIRTGVGPFHYDQGRRSDVDHARVEPSVQVLGCPIAQQCSMGAQGVRCPQARAILSMMPEAYCPLTHGLPMPLYGCSALTLTV